MGAGWSVVGLKRAMSPLTGLTTKKNTTAAMTRKVITTLMGSVGSC